MLRTERVGLLVLALAAFTAVTTEMLPVGLLPQIGDAFGRSDSTTGLLISLYAVMVMALAVPMTLATRRVPGRRLLLITTASYCLVNLVCALAPSFELFAAARAVGGITHAVFFSVCIGYASRLVPAARAGRALALVSAGPSAAFILGSPLATALGDAVGWRAAFGVLVLLTVVTFALLVTMLPAATSTATRTAAGPVRRGRRRAAVTVIIANALTYLGQFTLYSYVTVILLRSGAPPAAVAPLLCLFGVFGLVGLWRAAPLFDRDPRRAALIILTAVSVGVLALGASIPSLVLVIVSGIVWNTAFGPVASLMQSATIRTNAISPELSGAWINMTSNFGIAAGALLGGIVLDTLDTRALAWVGIAPIVLALSLFALNRQGFAPSPARRLAHV
jgi:predicted MFS family arabinose efflux permease